MHEQECDRDQERRRESESVEGERECEIEPERARAAERGVPGRGGEGKRGGESGLLVRLFFMPKRHLIV